MIKPKLTLGFCLLSMSLYAHGESPELFTLMGYLFLIPIIIGLVEYYLLSRRFEIKSKGKPKLILINLLITIIGFITAFNIGQYFRIENESSALLLIMIFLTILQVGFKAIIYNQLIISDKFNCSKMSKLLLYETLAINSLFYMVMMMIINN